MKGRCMTLRRYVVGLPRLALGAVVWLSVVASYDVVAAQVGYEPGHSPYHDIPRGAVWALSVGHLGGSRGDVGVGPADGLTGALRYEVPFGAVGASLGLAYARTSRFVEDYTKDSTSRRSGPFNDPVVLADVGLQLVLTGRKTWHRFAPFIGGALGVAIGSALAQDTSGYRFGTKITLEAPLSALLQGGDEYQRRQRDPRHGVVRPVDGAPVGHDRRGMDFLAEGFRRALALLFSGDAEVYGIALLTLKIGIVATVLACGLGLPLGFVLATRPFWGRRAALTVVNTALAFPTVVLGLLLYGLLSRRGPLGAVGWLYTWQAIALGDVLLALPIAAALAAAAVQGVDPRIRRTAETLGAGRWRSAWTVAREARFALAAVITTAFGHVVAEIGSAMTVGGNIRGQTRTLTTAVALYTSQGDFGLALALGLILLLLALLVNVALQTLQGRGHA